MAESADGEKSVKRGGRYCVAGAPNQQSCKNSNKTPGIRMHQFPTYLSIRAKWVQFIRRHRHDFTDPSSRYASLCSAHFDESCYERKLSLFSGVAELEMRSFLKRGSVPTRDPVIPEAPQVLSERSKRQVRCIESALTCSTCREFLEIFLKSV